MNNKKYISSAETVDYISDLGVKKVSMNRLKQILLGFLGGVFVAFATKASVLVSYNLTSDPNTYGLGQLVAGFVFGTGLMMGTFCSAELYNGNTLIITSVLDKKIKPLQMLKNWLYVYLTNFLGAFFIVILTFFSNIYNKGDNLLVSEVINMAHDKVNMSFLSAVSLGIMCNWLICTAIWISHKTKDVAGKILVIFFIMGLFRVSGYENSIANMYYIPSGILAKSNPIWADASGLSATALDSLNWNSFIIKNLLPVTLGNIIGGAGFVGGISWLAHRKKDK